MPSSAQSAGNISKACDQFNKHTPRAISLIVHPITQHLPPLVADLMQASMSARTDSPPHDAKEVDAKTTYVRHNAADGDKLLDAREIDVSAWLICVLDPRRRRLRWWQTRLIASRSTA